MFIDKDISNYIAMEGIKWSYTTILAPWQGGFYERLVCWYSKRSLRKEVERKHFTLEQLLTIVFNSMPFTYTYEDFESDFTLTPTHFCKNFISILEVLMTIIMMMIFNPEIGFSSQFIGKLAKGTDII